MFEITVNHGNLIILINSIFKFFFYYGSLPPSGNIHDIRVPVPGTSASEFEVNDTGKKKKGEDKNINWNLQVWFTVVQIKRQKILPQLIDRVGGHNIFIWRVLDIFSEPYYLLVVDYMYRLLKNSKYILDIMNSKHPLGCHLRGGGDSTESHFSSSTDLSWPCS